MKKSLLILASAALLFAGCAKEQFAGQIEGGLTEVTFTANLGNGVATKADADNDGDGINVNRCIMEIYFQNQLYKRLEQTVTPASGEAKAYATFSNVPVVAGKQYQILFWADCGNGTGDKYYTTSTTGTDNKGLTEVTIKHDAFIEALKNKKNDELDAFFAAKMHTVPQGGKNYTVTLHRPFAQLNVITTDVASGKTVTSAALLPEKVSVSYTAATTFNVADSTVTGSATYAYEAPVYGDWGTVATYHELTLSMDYLLASTEQRAVDVTFKTKNGGTVVMNHALTNLPFKRNYRTNVKGDLLTVGGTWTATIDADWLEPDIVKVVEVADIKSANEIIKQYAETTKQLEVKFTAEPNDSGVPAGEEAGIRAIVTTPIQQDGSLSIEVLTPTKELYIGDYRSEYIVSGEDVIKTDANHAVVNVNVPESSSIVKLVINAPSKSVYINGKEVANVGTITDLDAITSQNTLIIEKDQKVKNLTIRQGGLEIHGTVEQAIVPAEHGEIHVRDCENLDETKVYDILNPHIAEGYVGVKGRTTADLWDIVPAPFRVQKEGESTYSYFYSIAEAISAVGDNGTATITVMADHNFSFGVATFATVKAGQTITLDLNGKKIVSGSTLGSGSQAIENKGILTIVDTNGEGSWAHGASPSWIYDGSGSYVGSYVSNFITNRGTLYLNGGKLENLSSGSASYVADNFENSKITINGGNFNAASTAFRLFYGTVEMTVNGGIFTAGGYDIAQFTGNGSANNLIINGGEFTSDTDFNVYSWGETEGNHSTLKVTGGTFNQWVALSSKFNQIGNSVSGGKFYGAYNYGVGKFISGGVFEAEPDAQFVLDGYAVVANTDPATSAKYPYTVKVKPVVKIGNVEYADIADAFAAVPANTPTTVTLLENIGSKTGDVITWKEYDRRSAYEIKDGKNITFDLNGHKIYAKTTVTGYTCFFEVANGSSLTFKDSAGGGELNYLDGPINTGGLAIISYGKLIMQSGTIENYTNDVSDKSAIQGAVDIRANEWGTQYEHHSEFIMDGGVLKSQNNNTLRIFDSSQAGTGSVVVDFTINGGEVYGADAIFIQPAWTKTHSVNNIYMNNFNIFIKGGKFDTNNGIRVFGEVNETNNQQYKAIKISVTGGEFTIRKPSAKYRVGHIAYQNNYSSTAEAVPNLVSYTDVNWTADAPTYCEE